MKAIGMAVVPFAPQKSHGALVGMALLMLVCGRSVQAQSCNSGIIQEGGQYCIAATNPYTGNNPWMPTLSYSAWPHDNTCDSFTYVLELDFSEPSDQTGRGESYGLYQSQDPGQAGTGLPGTAYWQVSWSTNDGDAGQYGEGGNGSVSTYINSSYLETTSFQVYGQNPTPGSILTALNGMSPPWWYGHTLTQESSNRQFYPWQTQYDPSGTWTGTPVFGPPDGYGLTQIDGTGNPQLLTDNVMWTWTTNLSAGVGIANASQSGGVAYWAIQQSQEYSYEQGHSLAQGTDAPLSFTGTNYCSFMPTGSGRNAYSNGYGIAGYNLGNPDDPAPNGGLIGDNKGFASFQINTGSWSYNGWSYATLVCNQPSTTIQ